MKNRQLGEAPSKLQRRAPTTRQGNGKAASRALVRASERMKEAASSLQQPPPIAWRQLVRHGGHVSKPRAGLFKRHPRLRAGSTASSSHPALHFPSKLFRALFSGVSAFRCRSSLAAIAVALWARRPPKLTGWSAATQGWVRLESGWRKGLAVTGAKPRWMGPEWRTTAELGVSCGSSVMVRRVRDRHLEVADESLCRRRQVLTKDRQTTRPRRSIR